jgi:hypothetical protein
MLVKIKTTCSVIAGIAWILLGVRYQDIVNCFEHSTYFANVSGHRELPQAVLA